MAFLVDSHAHLYAEQFNEDREAMLQRAFDKGVQHFFLPNIDESSIEPMLHLESQYPKSCHAMMGLHPCSVDATYIETLSMMKKWWEKR